MLACMLQIFHAGLSDDTPGIHPIGEFEGVESKPVMPRCRYNWKRQSYCSSLTDLDSEEIKKLGHGIRDSRFQWAFRQRTSSLRPCVATYDSKTWSAKPSDWSVYIHVPAIREGCFLDHMGYR